jgi:hypothetical protein
MYETSPSASGSRRWRSASRRQQPSPWNASLLHKTSRSQSTKLRQVWQNCVIAAPYLFISFVFLGRIQLCSWVNRRSHLSTPRTIVDSRWPIASKLGEETRSGWCSQLYVHGTDDASISLNSVVGLQASGRFYYKNHETRQTTWVDPRSAQVRKTVRHQCLRLAAERLF